MNKGSKIKPRLAAVAAAGMFACGANAATPKTLVVMLDGLRSDAIENACAPNMEKLMSGNWQDGYNCAWTLSAQTVPDALASSAPNHAAIALGVTTAKNNVKNNGQYGNCNYKKYPSWLVRIMEANPSAKSLFLFAWRADKDLCRDSRVEFRWGGSLVTKEELAILGAAYAKDLADGAELERRLASGDAPDATLLFLDCPDHAGHGYLGDGPGFYPYASAYLRSIHVCDGIIGRCLDAIAKRPSFKDEDWLVIVTSDHGGYSNTHGLKGGHATAIPLIVSSRHVRQGRIPGTPHNYDIAPTVLSHFGIDWSGFDLDGRVVGGEVAVDRERPLAEGLAVYMPFNVKAAENVIPDGPQGAALGAATVLNPKGGFLGGALIVAPDTNAVGGVCLKESENLKFENGADFAATMWVRMDGPQKGDTLIFGNKNWRSGGNPGVALCASKCTENVKRAGVVFNCVSGPDSRRIDMGTYDVEYGKWTFYAVTRAADGVARVYQGAPDGKLYCIYADTADIRLSTGMPFHIGQDGTGRYGRVFEGRIDEFAMWTRALGHAEVRRIYEAGRRGLELGDIVGKK